MSKPRILIVGDSLLNITGLAYVSTSFMRYFINNSYPVAYATMSGEDSYPEDLEKFHSDYENKNLTANIPLYDCQFYDAKKVNGINDAILEFKPDIVISFLDPWKLDSIAYTAFRHKFYWVIYTTVEVPHYSNYVMYPTPVKSVVRKSLTEIMNKADLVIPVTRMAKKALEDINVKATEPVYNGIDFSLVQNPANHNKVDVFKNKVDKDTFIFMTMGVNSERKQIAKVIESYNKFLDKVGRNSNVKLYIHTNTDEQKNGPDLITMLMELDLVNKVLLPLHVSQGQQDKRIMLYRKYAIIDAYIGLPGGEGFGYGFAEAISHKKPVIYIDYGGHTDYLNGIGFPVKVKDYSYMAHSHIKLGLPDTDDAAKQMAKIYSTPQLRKAAGEKGYEFAVQNLSWDTVFNKLQDIIITDYTKNYKRTILSKLDFKKIV